MTKPQIIAFVVAYDENRTIGRDGGLPWRLPDDMTWFREKTWGKPVIMGRKTYESLPPRFRPLPGRQNIVLTRDRAYAAAGATIARTIADALAAAGDADEIVVAGGADVFRAFLPLVNRLYLTLIHAVIEGDVSLPPLDLNGWQEVFREEHPADDRHAHPFTWLILDRMAAE
jgi:dihydrofolate reductase